MNNLKTMPLKIVSTVAFSTISIGLLPTTGSAFTFTAEPIKKSDSKLLSGFYSATGLQSNTENTLFLDTGNGLKQDYIAVDAISTDLSTTLYDDLLNMGLLHGSQYGRTVSGLLPISKMSEIEALASLKFYRQPQFTTGVGDVTSQADISIRSDIARSTFGIDGNGVTVGVLSDSFNNLGGAINDVARGDLPGAGHPLGNDTPVNVLLDLPNGGSDEGRAMLQLVHDVAPGADLAFNTAFLGQASFANGILNLADMAEADVIVDDVIYFAEPMFQDGIIAQAVNSVVQSDVSYFSSAGNGGRNAYESSFLSTGIDLGLGDFHDFDPGIGVDPFQQITVPEGTGFSLSLQWDSPFFSVSGNGSPNDIDIFLIDEAITTVLAGSNNANEGQDPVEIFSFFNDGSFGTNIFNLAISRFSGPIPNFMKYVLFGFRGEINDFNTQSGTLYGHANAVGAEAVGASFFRQTPEFGVTPPVLEPFSSPGPTPIFFDTQGNRLATPEIRQKPEIVAPDGTSTTVPGFETFFGTSAAAPHAAAAAALIKEIAPEASPEDIYTFLESTAIDMDDPLTPDFDTGFDFASGVGLIQVDRAIAAAVAPVSIPEPSGVIALLTFGAIGLSTRIRQKR